MISWKLLVRRRLAQIESVAEGQWCQQQINQSIKERNRNFYLRQIEDYNSRVASQKALRSLYPLEVKAKLNNSLRQRLLLLLLSRFSCVWLCATLWTAAYKAPPSMGFSRQEHWSGLPLPSPILSYIITNRYSSVLFVFGLEITHMLAFPNKVAQFFKTCIV